MTATAPPYRRDRTTRAAFGALFAFGVVLSGLGPALPYLREAEGISYLVGALHQVAFAAGSGLAGVLAARQLPALPRTTLIAGGLGGAALAGLGLAYGRVPAATVTAALLMGLLGTAALIRVWAVVADVHGSRRAVAMTEGEVAVSLAGIVTPLLIGTFAATALSWRFAFVLGAVVTLLAALHARRVGMPPPVPHAPDPAPVPGGRRVQPTLVIVLAIVALEFALSFWLASYLSDDLGLTLGAAAAAVSGLYAANLTGRLLASRLARRVRAERLLLLAFAAALLGLPLLLAATGPVPAALGIAIAGTGIGAMFPLTASLHVKASRRGADGALGEVLTVAALGQVAGPLATGVIAQAADLRAGLLVTPLLVLVAVAALHRRGRAR